MKTRTGKYTTPSISVHTWIMWFKNYSDSNVQTAFSQLNRNVGKIFFGESWALRYEYNSGPQTFFHRFLSRRKVLYIEFSDGILDEKWKKLPRRLRYRYVYASHFRWIIAKLSSHENCNRKRRSSIIDASLQGHWRYTLHVIHAAFLFTYISYFLFTYNRGE